MQKIPTVFVRDMQTRQLSQLVTPGCVWVIDGEGVATEKIDGTACLVRDGKLYRRYDAKVGRTPPADFEPAQPEADAHTGHWPGWVPVGDGPDDQYHREAWAEWDTWEDGTYELVGPKIQGNPYNLTTHSLVKHGGDVLEIPHLTFSGIRLFLARHQMEGIVWYHPDGRKAKIKRNDFGLKWP